MPRPKRSKVAPSAPTSIPRLRVLQSEHEAPAGDNRNYKLSAASSTNLTNGSDESDGLVIARRDGKGRRMSKATEYVMSGALAHEDPGITHPKFASKKDEASLSKIVTAEKAQSRTLKAGLQSLGAPASVPATMPTEPAARTRRPSTLLHSSPQIVSSRASVARAQETPHMRSSLLGIDQFKKRARQPSLLQMVQSQPLAQDNVDEDDMYNILPDDESTPFTKNPSKNPLGISSSSSPPTFSSRKRKRVQSEIQVLASQPDSCRSRASRSPNSQASPESEDLYGVSDEENQVQPTLPPHRPTAARAPQIFSDTLAPPESSSPTRSEQNTKRSGKAPLKSKARTKQVKTKRVNQALPPPPSSSPSTQASPARQPFAKPLLTATLQNLLPRRHTRRELRSEYDILSSSDVETQHAGLGDEDDELSFHVSKVRRKKTTLKGSKSAARSKVDASKRVSRTYSRKTAVITDDDAENEDPSDTNGQEVEGTAADRTGKAGLDKEVNLEMKRLADKFREVDEYDLDFEDMTGSSSQMRDAR